MNKIKEEMLNELNGVIEKIKELQEEAPKINEIRNMDVQHKEKIKVLNERSAYLRKIFQLKAKYPFVFDEEINSSVEKIKFLQGSEMKFVKKEIMEVLLELIMEENEIRKIKKIIEEIKEKENKIEYSEMWEKLKEEVKCMSENGDKGLVSMAEGIWTVETANRILKCMNEMEWKAKMNN